MSETVAPPDSSPAVHLVELESVRRHLAMALAGATFRTVEMAPGLAGSSERAALESNLRGREVLRVERRARQLRFRLGDEVLRVSLDLGATPYVTSTLGAAPEHRLLALGFGSSWLTIAGAHSSVAVDLVRAEAEPVGATAAGAIDPISAAFTLGNFKRILRGKKRTISLLLVDDELIAGIGEPYADEILYAARLRPTRPVPSLSEEESRNLYYSILEVLQKAIRFGGMGVEGQALVEGRPGTFSRFLAVHGREGQECLGCRAQIRIAAMGKRLACYCPRCQN